jgi:aldose 1-epimerase
MKRTVITFTCLILLFFVFSSCNNTVKHGIILLNQNDFDSIIGGKKVQLYTLKNSNGCVAQFTNFGARWVSMWVPDKGGRFTDVVLGFNNLKAYISAGEPYHGAIVGRICGRINNAKFSLNGKSYLLANNDGFGKPEKNHLHGGINGFHRQVWDGEPFQNEQGEQGIIFSYLSKDGEEGFPGNLNVKVTYLLTNENEIKIDYTAKTDQATIVNLTNHSFFNLNGEGNANILKHQMKINSEEYIGCDRELIPTGMLKPVNDTPLDYKEYNAMGRGIDEDHDQIFKGKGYAAALVIKEKNSNSIQLVAEAYGDVSGIKIELYSDQPSLQIYNAWLFNGKDIGKSGKSYEFSGGFVMEPQGYPDAPNHENFPSIVLLPENEYQQHTLFKFSLIK